MKPTPEQIVQAFPHVRYEIEGFLLEPDYDKSDATLVETVHFRKMVHCRSLFYFFSQSSADRDKDDMVSEDFGYGPKEVYGRKKRELLDSFNKHVIHLTYERLKKTPGTKQWPMQKLFPEIEKMASEFILKVIKREIGPLPDASEMKLWVKLKDDLVNRRPLRQNTSNVAEPYGSAFQF